MSDVAAVRGEHAPGSIPAARRALREWIHEAGSAGRHFLQIHLLALPGDRYRVRHGDDAGLDIGVLDTSGDPYAARRIAQTTADGAHRPLKTAPDLRRGWSFEALDERGLWTVLDYLYPACAAHWYAGREGTLRITHWRETAWRQSGMYSSVKLLPEPAVRHAVRACCADAVCLRRVAWGLDAKDAAAIDPGVGVAGTSGSPIVNMENEVEAQVPCPEACSMFISFAREVLAVERSPRVELAGLGEVNELDVQQIRALVSAAADGGEAAPRTGEFNSPFNRRRLRYLAARLGTGP